MVKRRRGGPEKEERNKQILVAAKIGMPYTAIAECFHISRARVDQIVKIIEARHEEAVEASGNLEDI